MSALNGMTEYRFRVTAAAALLAVALAGGCSSDAKDSSRDDDPPITNLRAPVGFFPLSTAGTAMAASGDRVVLDYNDLDGSLHGLQMVDISSFENPVAVSRLDLTSFVRHLLWKEETILALQDDRVSQISVSQTEMAIQNEWIVPSFPYDIAAAGNALYVSTEMGVHVISTDDWDQIALLTDDAWGHGIPGSMSISGERLYLCGQNLGLAVWDISAPLNPELLGTTVFPIDFSPYISARDNLVVVSLAGDGVMVLDAADPANVVHLETITVDGQAGHLLFDGNFAVLESGDAGVYQLDAPSFESFTIKGVCETGHMVNAIALLEKWVIAEGIETGFSICERL